MLDFNSLRLIVPKNILIKWDQVLCESTILESHKFYCPFADCSALLINDDTTITQNNCPVCKRSICAACHVPWHSEFTCKEFGKLNMTNKKGKKDYEKLAMALAKKNKWKKCPNCKFFVEKAEGCVHITCRCKYEFCYDCGNKWTSNHGGNIIIDSMMSSKSAQRPQLILSKLGLIGNSAKKIKFPRHFIHPFETAASGWFINQRVAVDN
ncbi:IBR domain, Zinc finger, RING/FYVE/PHD-type, E3 ubiquitin ligase RBR family [Artemisia annua]|uniref:RBR-type E3 ubiquitin transferase n=1 Tax=Artemisia annua TaxID=35608 RepID=A0A2U1P0I4_ARTAN|nr:IBR domain, Zinc finger, RING/FYVE/PHD-type, E3 ubiquitin ligase RBR family [Artemisia annua]